MLGQAPVPTSHQAASSLRPCASPYCQSSGSWRSGIPPYCFGIHEHEPDEALGLLADDAVDLALTYDYNLAPAQHPGRRDARGDSHACGERGFITSPGYACANGAASGCRDGPPPSPWHPAAPT
jgi:hypothetical protein